MESINPKISSLMPINQNSSAVGFNPATSNKINWSNMNDVAAFAPHAMDGVFSFDAIMNKIATFRDVMTIAQDGVSAMKEKGESIRDLVARAKEEGITPEIMDKMQAEVDAKVAEIQKIKEGAEFDGIHPFKEAFAIDIPDILELMGANNKEEANNAISEMVGSFDIDIKIEGEGFNIGGTAKIDIGYTEDGALQINVDASMDYDLSGLVGEGGIASEDAFDLINNFVNMLGYQQGDLGNAQNFLDALLEQIFNVASGKMGESAEGIEFSPDSTSLKGQMVQQASITLDGMAGQAPNIAINLL